MKISYRTHPVLKKINDRNLGHLSCIESDKIEFDQIYDKINRIWGLCADLFNKNICYVTEPFQSAIDSAKSRMLSGDLINELINNNIAGVLIRGHGSFCYCIDNTPEGKLITVFHFERIADGLALTAFYVYSSAKGIANTYFSTAITDINDRKKAMQSFNNELFSIINFIRYADIERKYVEPKSKTKDFNCKYVNDTDCGITILDSKWFTTLVKSDAFKVRGHFRLQPKKKDGEWTKELIWINDFQKEGYTAPARKINTQL